MRTEKKLIDQVSYKGRNSEYMTGILVERAMEMGLSLIHISTCREALGDSVKIMMDANQGLNVPDALELAHRASSMGIQWFEEPVVHTCLLYTSRCV